MQAKEALDFVEPFTPLEATCKSEKEKRDGERYFLQLCLELLQKFPANVRSRQILEESGFMTVFESSLTLPFHDSSYLHILLYGHSNDGGYIDFGIALEEHDGNSLPTDGYIYSYDAQGLIRTNVPRDDTEFEEGDDPHFSVIAMYNSLDELSDLEISRDEEAREYARQTRASLDEGVLLERWECELGYDGQAPSRQELHQLTSILALASPRRM